MPLCVNPDHLYLGTHAENMADCKNKNRHAWGERNSKAKLTAKDVMSLRREYRKFGAHRSNIDELAEKYGVAKVTAYSAATGRSWRNLK